MRYGGVFSAVLVAFFLAGGLMFAQEKPAPTTATEADSKPAEPVETTRVPGVPVQEPPKTPETPAPAGVPDYKDLLNRQLRPSPTTAPPTERDPAQMPYALPYGQAPIEPPDLTPPSAEKMLEKIQPLSPEAPGYRPNKSSYELLQEQMRRRDLTRELGSAIGPIGTSNPNLYRQQLTGDVSRLLERQMGVSAVPGQVDLDVLLGVPKTVSPTPSLFPDPTTRFTPQTVMGFQSVGASGATPQSNQLARINAGYGSKPDLHQFHSLSNPYEFSIERYSTYRSREYGTIGTTQAPYSVPSAYTPQMMYEQGRYLRESYGLNVDPNRVTYSELYLLRSGLQPR